ncbi:hypothetical protein PFLmoz3_03774 [Pseudomonas fluorescens]|uniref:Uncharacterized protein n=1 Tax=Pseudomonas fluorescens TaxID=294 RepID=A0A109LFD7_PSEFL|nr:hypothetical protein PFLmoz3_03774 [Pseudomonas fluorescens]
MPTVPSSIASPSANSKPCNRICRNAAPSLRPAAWAANPVEPMRRKPMAQARKVYRLAPTATAPSWWAWGRWPMTMLSTRATKGTEIFDRIIGAARAQTRRWVGRWRQSVSRAVMKAPWWSGIVTVNPPHSRANVGPGLPAIAVGQPVKISAERPLSQASQLPLFDLQWLWDLAWLHAHLEPTAPPSVNVTGAAAAWSALIYSSPLGSL